VVLFFSKRKKRFVKPEIRGVTTSPYEGAQRAFKSDNSKTDKVFRIFVQFPIFGRLFLKKLRNLLLTI